MNQDLTHSKVNPACPQPAVLREFMQGLLEPPELENCESHVADCQACHETLRGLNSDDTLSQYVTKAIQAKQGTRQASQSDSQEIASLIGRLLHPTNEHTGRPKRSADAEILADRAAEVLRYLEPANADPETGEVGLGKLDNYLLYRLIGAGSTGVVFHAIDQSLNRNVALKVLRPSLGAVARERFMAEAKVAASIEHAHVVTIYQVGSMDRLAYIAMQWLPGQTLEQRLLESELEEAEIRQIVSQIAAGLSAAHQKQLVHRDIKPANIWICETSDEVKILDFGLARIADDDPGLTATGMLAGTPNFMSPEQTRGLELDGRSDLFSLGCILYRLLTGRLPFGAPTVLATLQSIQNQHPDPPQLVQASISSELSDLAMCLLEKQPNNRLGSATQLTQMLNRPRDQWPTKVASYATRVATPANNLSDANSNSKGGNWSRWAALVGLSLLGTFGYLFAPQILRIATDQGEIVINSDDKDVSINVSQDGKLVTVLDAATSNSFNIRAGQYEIEAVGNGESDSVESKNSYQVSPNSFAMKRGQQTIVTVNRVPSDIGTAIANPDVESKEKIVDQRTAIYNGRTFEQWHDIANRDRDPKTAGDAMLACSRLAESESEVAELRDIIQKLARKYVSFVIGKDDEVDAMRANLLKSLSSQGPKFAVDFALEEFESGNAKSRGFCVWLTRIGSVYQRSHREVYGEKTPELHQEAFIRAGDLLLAAALRMDFREDLKGDLIRDICRNLYPKEPPKIPGPVETQTMAQVGDRHYVTVPFTGHGLFEMKELERLNPKLRQAVRDLYEGFAGDLYIKKSLGYLALAYFAKDKDFHAEHVEQLFNPETEPATRDVVLELVTGNMSPDLIATTLLLLLENQFPHPNDHEHRDWLESLFDDLPEGYSKSNFSSKVPLKFESNKRSFYSWGYDGQFSSAVFPKFEFSQGATTSTTARFLVSSLWAIEPALSPDYKQKVLLKFMKKWMSINELQPKTTQKGFSALRIKADVQQMIEMLNSGKSRRDLIQDRKLSDFVSQFGSISSDAGISFGGSGGGGVF